MDPSLEAIQSVVFREAHAQIFVPLNGNSWEKDVFYPINKNIIPDFKTGTVQIMSTLCTSYKAYHRFS